RVPDIGGLKLNRAPLVEGRYLHYAPANRLELSPGFAKEKPATYETAFGRVLSPQFERKCVTCHGQPRTRGTHVDVGVTCESCHGPGQAHLSALAKKSRDLAILNPKKLASAERSAHLRSGHRAEEQRVLAAEWRPDRLYQLSRPARGRSARHPGGPVG